MRKTTRVAASRTGKPTTLRWLRVRQLIGDKAKGQLLVAGAVHPCALGRTGITCVKREGDGFSPRGAFRLRGGYFRIDRLGIRPRSRLPLRPTRRNDGWCDDACDRRYNKPIQLPAPGVSAEQLWREDKLYDVVIDLDYNRNPIRTGRGSAIFLHLARPGFLPTEGCVALGRRDLLRLLSRLSTQTRLTIG